MDIVVEAKQDLIQNIGKNCSVVTALSELIWNGIDAQATKIDIVLERNPLDLIEAIIVTDNGEGFSYDDAQEYFGGLGGSWKKDKSRGSKKIPYHGKNGKGRFRAFKLGKKVSWTTITKINGELYSFTVSSNISTIKNFKRSPSIKLGNISETGTTVKINDLENCAQTIIQEKIFQKLTTQFARFLTNYPIISIVFDGEKIDPSEIQKNVHAEDIEYVLKKSKEKITLKIDIIEWNIECGNSIYLCENSGITLKEINSNVRSFGENFSAYIKSNYIDNLEKNGLLELEDIHPELNEITEFSTEIIQKYFNNKRNAQREKLIEKWKLAKIYPYKKSISDSSESEIAEMDIFNTLALKVQEKLPLFKSDDIESQKFTFLLLSQALKRNPESLREIITSVLHLKKEDRDSLHSLIKKTSLPAIITTAQIVADRLEFITALETLVFGFKKTFKEKSQLHKMLETESWIFDELFSLSGSEMGLEEVLNKHLHLLEGKRKTDSKIKLPDGKNGRIDIMLHKATRPSQEGRNFLIVELKRPSVKIDQKVLTQVEKYALAIYEDERYDQNKCKWKFIAISNEIDSYVKKRANQENLLPGEVFKYDNLTVIVKTWAELFEEARTSLEFMRSQLNYHATQANAKDYVSKKYNDCLPEGFITSK